MPSDNDTKFDASDNNDSVVDTISFFLNPLNYINAFSMSIPSIDEVSDDDASSIMTATEIFDIVTN